MAHLNKSILDVAEVSTTLVGVYAIGCSDLVVSHFGEDTDILFELFRILVVRVDLEDSDLTSELGLYNCDRHLTPISDVKPWDLSSITCILQTPSELVLGPDLSILRP